MTHSEKDKELVSDYNLKESIQPVIQLTIPGDYMGMRLDQALAKLLPDFSRNRIQNWITENRVILNQQPASTKQKVWGNESIQVFPKSVPENESTHAAEAIQLDIIHEDNAIIVLNKPAGLVTHPGNGNWQGTLLNALLHQLTISKIVAVTVSIFFILSKWASSMPVITAKSGRTILQISSIFLVFEWAIVIVQFSSKNNKAAGFPTKIERPIMTTFTS